MRILSAILVVLFALNAQPCRAQDALRATYWLEPMTDDALIVPSSAFRPFQLRLQFLNSGEHAAGATKYRIESLALLPRNDGVVDVPLLPAGGSLEVVVPVMVAVELGSADLRLIDDASRAHMTAQPLYEREGR